MEVQYTGIYNCSLQHSQTSENSRSWCVAKFLAWEILSVLSRLSWGPASSRKPLQTLQPAVTLCSFECNTPIKCFHRWAVETGIPSALVTALWPTFDFICSSSRRTHASSNSPHLVGIPPHPPQMHLLTGLSLIWGELGLWMSPAGSVGESIVPRENPSAVGCGNQWINTFACCF